MSNSGFFSASKAMVDDPKPLERVHPFAASLVITTRNRREDLANAITLALAQTIRLEIIVVDDGSTNGTSEMVRTNFSSVVLHRADPAHGYIVQRNFGASLAQAPVIFSLDDDAAFTTPEVVAQTLAGFDRPTVGVVSIPFIDVNQNAGCVRQQAPSSDPVLGLPGVRRHGPCPPPRCVSPTRRLPRVALPPRRGRRLLSADAGRRLPDALGQF